MGRFCACALAIASVCLVSCHQVQDCIDEQVASCRSQQLARCAWWRSRGNYVECQDNLCDFGSGFRYGYADILGGGKGCPPIVPPRSYWGCCYHGPEGKCAVVSWYDGYQHGAAAALADGYSADYSSVPTSIDLYRRCSGQAVQLDLERYKASAGAPPHQSDDSFDGPPLPTSVVEPVEEPYSPPIDAPELPEASVQPSRAQQEAGGPVRLSARIDELN